MKFRLLPFVSFLLLPLAAFAMGPRAEKVKLTALEDRVRIEIGDKLFSEYIFRGASKPYLYPILMADGTGLTRNWPQRDTPGEEHDHPHHRSLWFSHGSVNSYDFWVQDRADAKMPTRGSIVHDALLETKSGATGVIRTRNRWVAPDGKLVCTDEQVVTVRTVPEGRLMDYEITIHAPVDTPVVFGDTKEGTMSIRLNEDMRLMRRGPDKKNVPGAGHIVNSEGARDGETWGKPAAWVDYYAPLGGTTYGVAIFDHPKNPRHPTWWHVRDYGLFAANPFGKHDFEKLKDATAGNFTVPAGGKVTFRYRFYFHQGDTAAAKVADRFRAFAAAR